MSSHQQQSNDKLFVPEIAAKPLHGSDFSVTADRFIVFLDILGFKERVARSSHQDVLKDLRGLQADINDFMLEHHDQRLQISLFSDSIVLFSPDTGVESLTAIAEAAAYIMRTAIGSGIPMKGALAQGVVTNDTDKQLFFGLPIIDAYLLQENVKYYGVVVHHSAEQSVIGMPLFTDAPTPLRSGKVHHYQLNWFMDSEKQVSEEACRDIEALRYSVSDEPRKYVDNTMELIRCVSGPASAAE